MGCRRITIIIAAAAWVALSLLPVTSGLFAQSERDFVFYDLTTLRLYESRDWKALVPVAKEAIDQGFDYYYLRLRLGLAYYELGRHRLAAPQFQKALLFNSGDPYAREMHYYALLLGGQAAAARLVLPEGRPFLDLLTIQAEGGWKQSDQQTPVDDLFYFNGGISHTLGRSLQFAHQYQQVFQKFVFFEEVDDNGHGQGGPPSTSLKRIEQYVDQHEYYLGPRLQLRRGWSLQGGFRQIWVQDTIGHYGEQAYALSLTKAWPHLTISASGGFGTFGHKDHWQYGLETVLYPLGSTRWYYGASATLKTTETDTSGLTPYWIAQKMGLRIAPNLWLEGQYAFGDISGFSESIAALVYNFDDRFQQRYGGGLQYWIKGKHLLYVYYLREKKIWNVDNSSAFQHQVLLGGVQLAF